MQQAIRKLIFGKEERQTMVNPITEANQSLKKMPTGIEGFDGITGGGGRHRGDGFTSSVSAGLGHRGRTGRN